MDSREKKFQLQALQNVIFRTWRITINYQLPWIDGLWDSEDDKKEHERNEMENAIAGIFNSAERSREGEVWEAIKGLLSMRLFFLSEVVADEFCFCDDGAEAKLEAYTAKYSASDSLEDRFMAAFCGPMYDKKRMEIINDTVCFIRSYNEEPDDYDEHSQQFYFSGKRLSGLLLSVRNWIDNDIGQGFELAREIYKKFYHEIVGLKTTSLD